MHIHWAIDHHEKTCISILQCSTHRPTNSIAVRPSLVVSSKNLKHNCLAAYNGSDKYHTTKPLTHNCLVSYSRVPDKYHTANISTHNCLAGYDTAVAPINITPLTFRHTISWSVTVAAAPINTTPLLTRDFSVGYSSSSGSDGATTTNVRHTIARSATALDIDTTPLIFFTHDFLVGYCSGSDKYSTPLKILTHNCFVRHTIPSFDTRLLGRLQQRLRWRHPRH